MAIAGEISYKITVDTKQLKQGLDESSKAVANSAKSTKSKFGEIAKGVGKGALQVAGFVAKSTAAIAAASTAALTALATTATKGFANYEQLVGGVDTLFGDASAKVQAYADQAFNKVGISANDYMEQVTSFSASLLQSLGGDTGKAADAANEAMVDMADNANKMGTSLESIQNAYQGFAKQNYTMLDNLKLGYGGTKQEMERLLADAEKLTGVKYDISNFADVTAAIHAIQTEMGIAGTTAKEAGETFSGSLTAAKAAWSNLMVEIAKPDGDIGAKMDEFMEAARTFASNALPILERALLGAVDLVKGIAPAIISALPELVSQLLPAVLDATVGLIDAIVAALPELIGVITSIAPQIVDAVMKIFDTLVANLPTFCRPSSTSRSESSTRYSRNFHRY